MAYPLRVKEKCHVLKTLISQRFKPMALLLSGYGIYLFSAYRGNGSSSPNSCPLKMVGNHSTLQDRHHTGMLYMMESDGTFKSRFPQVGQTYHSLAITNSTPLVHTSGEASNRFVVLALPTANASLVCGGDPDYHRLNSPYSMPPYTFSMSPTEDGREFCAAFRFSA